MYPRRPACGPVPSGNCTILIVVFFCLRSQNTDKFDPFVSSLGINFHVMILDLNHTKMSSHSSTHQNPPSRRNETFSAIFFAKKIIEVRTTYILTCYLLFVARTHSLRWPLPLINRCHTSLAWRRHMRSLAHSTPVTWNSTGTHCGVRHSSFLWQMLQI
jgi:hypothetical protein